MSDRFARQSFLGQDSERTLAGLQVGIVGLGGGGSHVVQQLAHLGVKALVLVDPDRIESSNLNRLVGGTLDDVKNAAWKVDIGARVARSIAADSAVLPIAKRWQDEPESLRVCDIIFGCVDTFAARAELEQFCRRHLVVYIDIGMDVHDGPKNEFSITGQVAVSIPGSACLRCMNVLRQDLLEKEADGYGAAGSRPQVVWPNGVLASFAVGLMIQLVTPWHDTHHKVTLLEYDGNKPELVESAASSFLRSKVCEHFDADLGDPWFGR